MGFSWIKSIVMRLKLYSLLREFLFPCAGFKTGRQIGTFHVLDKVRIVCYDVMWSISTSGMFGCYWQSVRVKQGVSVFVMTSAG